VSLASLLFNNFFTKNPYKENLKMIFNKVNNKEVRKIISFSNNYGIGMHDIPDVCNILANSNISNQGYFESREHVNKKISLLIFLMLR